MRLKADMCMRRNCFFWQAMTNKGLNILVRLGLVVDDLNKGFR
jgi:hypothetical protein